MAPPKGFVDLSTAYGSPVDSFVTIIGTVVDVQNAAPTRSGQFMITFKLLDDVLRDAYHGSDGLKVRFFNSDIRALPQVQQCGDVVLLRNVKITMFSDQPVALSNFQTGVLVFPAASIPTPEYQIAFQDKKRIQCLGKPTDVQRLTLQEQAYIIQLKQEMSTTLQSLADRQAERQADKQANFRYDPPTGPSAMLRPPAQRPPSTSFNGNEATKKRSGDELPTPEAKKFKPSSFGPKFCKVSETQHGTWADLCVMVVKKFATNAGTCELYVTDYTENKHVYQYLPPEAESGGARDGDEYGYSGNGPKKEWPGPYGQLVLRVNVKQPHSDYANRHVEEGDFVLLQNVKMRAMPDGNCRLEGNMWPDHQDPERVKIRKLKDRDLPEIATVLERKNRYWVARNAKLGLESGEGGKKFSEMSKKEKKKFNKQLKKGREKLVEEVKPIVEPVTEDTEVTVVQPKLKINPHVRCGHREVTLSTLQDIQDLENKRHTHDSDDGRTHILPFVNARYRVCVRVVDFQPKSLVHFSFPKSGDISQRTEDEDLILLDDDPTPGYEWSFCLLLEDAHPNELVSSSPFLDQCWSRRSAVPFRQRHR